MATATRSTQEKNQPRETAEELRSDGLPLEERIRRRAHGIWLERNGQGGSDTEDWLQAERQIRGETEV